MVAADIPSTNGFVQDGARDGSRDGLEGRPRPRFQPATAAAGIVGAVRQRIPRGGADNAAALGAAGEDPIR